jgi:Protein of unknown function (DUF2889)
MSGLVPGHKLHTRTYDVDAFVVDDSHFRLVGRVHDQKPDGLWGIADTSPMSLHEMTLTLVVRVRDLTIVEVETAMTAYPQRECPLIVPAYQQLVGLSIARGFSQKVKELFGGPRACTHIGALINAMAPVAMQTVWAYSHVESPSTAVSTPGSTNVPTTTAEKQRSRALAGAERNRDTCHVWSTGGPMITRIEGGELGVPLWAEKRLAELGLDLEEWQKSVFR